MEEFEAYMGIFKGIISGLIFMAIGAVLLSVGENFGYVMVFFAGVMLTIGIVGGYLALRERSKEDTDGK
jgi:uncharacterized membrane protein